MYSYFNDDYTDNNVMSKSAPPTVDVATDEAKQPYAFCNFEVQHVDKWYKIILSMAQKPLENDRNQDLYSILKSNTKKDGSAPTAQEKAKAGAWLAPLATRTGTRDIIHQSEDDGYVMLTRVQEWAKKQRETKSSLSSAKTFLSNPHAK